MLMMSEDRIGSTDSATQPAGAPARVTEENHSRSPIPPSLFNEAAYLAANPDVAAAVAAGQQEPYGHYLNHGFQEELRGDRPRQLPKQSPTLGLRENRDNSVIDRLIDLETEKRALLEAWDRQLLSIGPVTFKMISEEPEEAILPPLDRSDVDPSRLDADQTFWRDNGYIIKEGFIPENLIDRYCDIRSRHPRPGGWVSPVPYMQIAELRDISLYPPTMDLMKRLIGEDMGLHLNLTGWVSTDRNWHQDDYLNPHFVNSWYAAAWVALDDIHPDCGPFEFVPGSHKWPLMRGHKVRMYLQPHERNNDGWPILAERFVNDLSEAEIAARGAPTKKFIAKKGDLLIWHGRLMHRGSYANQPGMERRTLISHYSGLTHRVDMPHVERTPEGSAYFVHHRPLDWDPYADGAE